VKDRPVPARAIVHARIAAPRRRPGAAPDRESATAVGGNPV